MKDGRRQNKRQEVKSIAHPTSAGMGCVCLAVTTVNASVETFTVHLSSKTGMKSMKNTTSFLSLQLPHHKSAGTRPSLQVRKPGEYGELKGRGNREEGR